MNRIIPILLCLVIALLACNDPQEQKSGQQTTTPEVSTNPQKNTRTNGPVVLKDAYLPSITMEKLTNLWNNCNQMDYIFYELPISSSVSDRPSAQAHIRHISDTPVSQTEKNRCAKSIGRIFYKAEGEDLIDAEVYFGGGCAFFVFYQNGKKTYSNLMTPDGVNHFNQIIAAAQGRTGQ